MSSIPPPGASLAAAQPAGGLLGDPGSVPREDPPLSASARFRLAWRTRDAVLRVPGVSALDSGPVGLFVTAERGNRVEGVLCTAAGAQGGYEVSLRLVCRLVPLHALGAQVQAEVQRVARSEQVMLVRVQVHMAEVVEPEPS